MLLNFQLRQWSKSSIFAFCNDSDCYKSSIKTRGGRMSSDAIIETRNLALSAGENQTGGEVGYPCGESIPNGPKKGKVGRPRKERTERMDKWCRVCVNAVDENGHRGRKKRYDVTKNGNRGIVQMDMSGRGVKLWGSVQRCVDETGMRYQSIYNCLIGKAKSGCGYKWCWADEYL